MLECNKIGAHAIICNKIGAHAIISTYKHTHTHAPNQASTRTHPHTRTYTCNKIHYMFLNKSTHKRCDGFWGDHATAGCLGLKSLESKVLLALNPRAPSSRGLFSCRKTKERRIQQVLFGKRDTFSRTFFGRRNMIP